jgi:hypothetical protein
MPDFSDIEPSNSTVHAEAFATLQAKWETSGAWAIWAESLLATRFADMKNLLASDVVTPELQALISLIDSIPEYTPGTITGYTAPTAPTYTVVPSYTAPTLGTIQDIPDVVDITVPDAPSTAISFTNSAFSDSLLTKLKAQLESDMGTGYEAAMFTRHTARVTAERAANYTEITTQFSARGFDMPTGALLAKQTEMNNESSKRLTDASADIMAEGSKLAMSSAVQLLDLMGRLNDSKIMRDFEAAKVTVQLAVDGFKATIEGLVAKGNLNKAAIEATVSANDGTVKAFLGEIEGQTAPMKAIADSNQAQASAYRAAVEGASASVQASALPEELKIKQIDLEIRRASASGEIAGKVATIQIETAFRQLQTELEVMKGQAAAAQQVIASALNSVQANSSFGFSGSASTSYDGQITEQIQGRKDVAMISKTGHT